MKYENLLYNIYVYVAETPLFAAKMPINKIKQNKRK